MDERTSLRDKISDYLIDRVDEPWMIDLLVVSQELSLEDVNDSRSDEMQVGREPKGKIAEIALEDPDELEPVSEETMDAMRWASKIDDDSGVLALVRGLPIQVVQEQVRRYKERGTAVAARSLPKYKIVVGSFPSVKCKHAVAKRFDAYLEMCGLMHAARLPRGCMTTFIAENISLSDGTRMIKDKAGSKQKHLNVRCWHKAWLVEQPDGVTAVAARSQLKSRAPKPTWRRTRAAGGGRQCANPLCRQELYEWFASIRYAIDWKKVIAENRSQGLQKNLARFPRSIMKVKVLQLLREHAQACILNGLPVQTFKPDSWWFARWQEDYGLSLRQANRKYQVPRHVLKQRLELFWISLFRVRQLAVLVFGYEPVLFNFDQTPYHHNESGSQNKATLGVRGSTVPVVEGNSDVKSRWTANLTTCSSETAVAAMIPPAECMFKGTKDCKVHKRLIEHSRQRGFPSWFTVSLSQKGSYRESDVIAFLKQHLEPWKTGREWRIMFADDFAAHKTENVFHLCWERGYVLIVHGGGATPVAQTPDTDLNEEVRRLYGNRECALLMDKMRYGQTVPKLSNEECMDLMYLVLSDVELHKKAARGYEKVGQSIDLHGSEDNQIVREAATFWNAETTCGLANMRSKVNAEIAEVAE